MLELQVEQGFVSTQALELVAGDDGAVVLGVRSPELQEVGEEPLPGQLFNVFTLRDACISSVQDFAKRADALRAAGAEEPSWV